MSDETNPYEGPWGEVQRVVDEFVLDYELCFENEHGEEGTHSPTENERLLISDAIAGLIADDEFQAVIRAALAVAEGDRTNTTD